MELLLVTIRGLEEAVKEEARVRGLAVIPFDVKSRVLVRGNLEKALGMRTISAVCRVIGYGETGTELRELRQTVRGILREAEEREGPVRVRAYVFGDCYSRREVERVVSREVKRVWRVEADPRASRELQVDVDCHSGVTCLSMRVKVFSGRREYYVERHPQSLNPLIAAALSWYSGVGEGDLVYDPMCGAGTIPVEFALSRGCTCIASDVSSVFVRGARENAGRAGVDVEFFVADVASPPVNVEAVDLLATDPPRRLGDASRSIRSVLELGVSRVSLVTPYLSMASNLAWEGGYGVRRLVKTFQGGEPVYLLVMEKEGEIRLALSRTHSTCPPPLYI